MTYKEFMDILDLYALECPEDATFRKQYATQFNALSQQNWWVLVDTGSPLLAYLPPGCIAPSGLVGLGELVQVSWT